MNAARRAMIAQVRHESGCSGKEAYEATKDPSFMKDWVRVVVPVEKDNSKPKPISYRAHRQYLKKIRALSKLKMSKQNE